MRPGDGGEGLRKVALRRLEADPRLELYVFGHTHSTVVGRGAGGRVFANPGAWMDQPSFLRVGPERVELLQLSGRLIEVRQSLERGPFQLRPQPMQ